MERLAAQPVARPGTRSAQHLHAPTARAEDIGFSAAYADAPRSMTERSRYFAQRSSLRIARAAHRFDWHANPKPLHSAIQRIVERESRISGGPRRRWLSLAICERDPLAPAERAVAAMPAQGYSNEGFSFPRSWCEAGCAPEELVIRKSPLLFHSGSRQKSRNGSRISRITAHHWRPRNDRCRAREARTKRSAKAGARSSCCRWKRIRSTAPLRSSISRSPTRGR